MRFRSAQEKIWWGLQIQFRFNKYINMDDEEKVEEVEEKSVETETENTENNTQE